jgi:2-dehydropantoate 2-reductase
MRRMFREAAAIARAMGCALPDDLLGSLEKNRDSPHKPSILQDLEAGRPMEVAALYEAPLELARLAGVATPTLDLAVAIARHRARRAGLLP